MGHVGGRRFSVGKLHAASKTSSANGSHLIINVWDFDISAAKFPQQKKTRVFGPIHTKDARFAGDQVSRLCYVYTEARPS